MVVFHVHTLPITCFTSLSKFIVTVYQKIGHGSLSAYVAVSVCAGIFVKCW